MLVEERSQLLEDIEAARAVAAAAGDAEALARDNRSLREQVPRCVRAPVYRWATRSLGCVRGSGCFFCVAGPGPALAACQ